MPQVPQVPQRRGWFAPAAGPRIGLDRDVADDANDAAPMICSLALAREVASFAMTQCRKCRKCRNIFAETRKACLARCGRSWTSSPSGSLKRLGLPMGKPVKVRYADERQANRHRAEGVYVELLGRHGTFTAVVEPGRQTALVGAIVLEDLARGQLSVGPRWSAESGGRNSCIWPVLCIFGGEIGGPFAPVVRTFEASYLPRT